LAKGLFRRVIAESGSVLLDHGAFPLHTAEQQGEKLAGQAQLPSGAGVLKALRSAPVEQLLDAFANSVGPGGIPPGLGVDVDGRVLPQPPAEVFASGKQLPADLMIGINAREFGGSPNAAVVQKDMESRYGKLAGRALPLYGLTTSSIGTVSQDPPNPLYGTAGAQWSTDTAFRCPAVAVAGWNSSAHHPSYVYQFDRAAPGKESDGAVHASEVVYVFGNLDEQHPGRPNYQAADYEISRAMQRYWTSFAKTGSPAGNGLPAWPLYQPDTRQHLAFTDSGPVAGANLRRAQCDVFAEVLKQQADKASGTTH
jgi:para-nitrobenzyl esterase